MLKIPVVFSFDDKMLLPAGVCLSSLLVHAAPNTFYDIFILHDDKCKYPASGYLERLFDHFSNFNINYRNVAERFYGAYETRGISIATYYRLLIPEIITEYKKVMYHDVDLVFRTDLSDIFLGTDLTGYYVAGVLSPGNLVKEVREYREALGIDCSRYILAGDIILNLDLMREDGLVEKFIQSVSCSSYRYQDMDILNLICNGKVKLLKPSFCATVEIFEMAIYDTKQNLFTKQELKEVLESGIIHYNGTKPWQAYCPNFDFWWMYYRQSMFYDPRFYFDFFKEKQSEYDQLSFKKRLKILLRYFLPPRSTNTIKHG